MQRPFCEIRTAGSGIGNAPALSNPRCPWQPAAPVGGIADLPPTNQVIQSPTRVPHVLLALAEGQFVDGIEDEDVVAVEINSSPRIDVADRVVVILGVAVCLRVGVVSQQL